MALPSTSDFNALSWAFLGQPFAIYHPGSSSDTPTLSYALNGQPVYAQGTGAGSGGTPAARPVVFVAT